MGPEEHGGHCELAFEGLEISAEHVLLGEGRGLKLTQIRLGPARLTHCMRWLGLAKRSHGDRADYVEGAQGFRRRSWPSAKACRSCSATVASDIQIGRLLTMQAAWALDRGELPRKEVSMAKIHVADTLHKAVDTAIQLMARRAIRRTRCSNGSIAMPGRRAWSTALRKSMRWCLPATIASRETTSGAGASKRNQLRELNGCDAVVVL